MSDLLNKASLVVIPSGYKEDTVYSVVPSDGSGDLSFTRASNGTRVNSAGLVEVCPWNLVSYSEQFDSPFWNKGTSGSATFVVTANATTAPNGTNTADLISITRSATSELAATYTFVGQGVGTFKNTIWLKAKDSSNVGKTIDLWSWEGDTRGYTKVTLTADWVRYEQNTTVFTGTASELFDFGLLPISYSTSTTLAVEFYAWGAQSNIGATAKPYFPTTDRLNVPRLTYQNGGSGCPSLLLEKQSTNVSYQSTVTSFGSGTNDWLNGAGSPASINQTTGIDGTQNGARYTRTAGQTTNDFFYKNQVPVTSGTTYTVSGYIKLGTASNAVIVINNTSAWNSVANGSIVCSTANGFSTTAWKRFELTITAPSTNKINIHYGYHQEFGVDAQATGTFFLDGLQVEASSYATSLINTNGASATRVADLASVSQGTIANFGTGAFSVFFDINYAKLGDAGQLALLGNRQSGNWWRVRGDGTNIDLELNGSNGYALNQILNTPEITSRTKIAFTRNGNSLICYVNGVQKFSTNNIANSSDFTTGNSYVEFNAWDNGTYHIACTEYNEAVLFKTALTATELASLTTI